MSDIVGLYILNRRGELIYLQENTLPSSKELDPDYLSNFFTTLQTIAQKNGARAFIGKTAKSVK